MKAAATNRNRCGDGSNGQESLYTRISRAGGKVIKGGKFTTDHDFAVAMARMSVELRGPEKRVGEGLILILLPTLWPFP